MNNLRQTAEIIFEHQVHIRVNINETFYTKMLNFFNKIENIKNVRIWFFVENNGVTKYALFQAEHYKIKVDHTLYGAPRTTPSSQ
jgi:hypothetical protein